jgi:hypothetical protein
MKVANILLCKELYKLSGWYEVETYYEDYPVLGGSKLRSGYPGNILPKMLHEYITPAHDLDYLLDKLPKHIIIGDTQYELVMRSLTAADIRFHYWSDVKRHRALSTGTDSGLIGGFGDKPVNAACKLAIHLIKEGLIEGDKK